MRHQVSVDWEQVDPRRIAYRGGDLYTHHLPKGSLWRPFGRCSCGWRDEPVVEWSTALYHATKHKTEVTPDRRMTKHGLTLILRAATGAWETEDGLTTIGRAREVTTCDGQPHPFFEIDEWTGRRISRYCDGMGEHDRECGWDLRGSGDIGDLFPTLDAAWAELARLRRATQ